MIFYKIIRSDRNHYGHIYTEGLNVDRVKFNPSGSCLEGGLYFTDKSHLGRFYNYGDQVAVITIPDDALVYKDPDGDKWKADCIYIQRFEPISMYWKDPEFYIDAIKHNGYALQYIETQTNEMCILAVKCKPLALQYVRKDLQTSEMCTYAVERIPLAFMYVKKDLQTSDMCIKAIRADPLLSKYVRNDVQIYKDILRSVIIDRIIILIFSFIYVF